jgi:hypothetical protein
MKIWYDTEFIDDGRTIDLISIGMVSEDGREYYAVNSEMDTTAIEGRRWLMENVVPGLPVTDYCRQQLGRRTGSNAPWGKVILDLKCASVKPRWVIANEVRDFLQATPDVELWSWYAAYDHVALAQLFGPMSQLPKGIPMWTNDLQQLAMQIGDETIPGHPGSEHNALADAHHHQMIHKSLGKPTLHPTRLVDLLEDAWCVIANSGVFGNPSEPTEGCREAAERWRDRWHATLAAHVKQYPDLTPLIISEQEARDMGLIPAGPTAEESPCETCGGTGQVHEEGIIGAPGSGGDAPCPDCTKTRPRP